MKRISMELSEYNEDIKNAQLIGQSKTITECLTVLGRNEQMLAVLNNRDNIKTLGDQFYLFLTKVSDQWEQFVKDEQALNQPEEVLVPVVETNETK